MDSNFPALLSRLRRERGISQKQAAGELGVSQALLSHYENGIRECGLSFLKRAASYYQVSSDYLLGLSSSRLQPEGANEPAGDGLLLYRAMCELLILARKSHDGEAGEQEYGYGKLCLYRAALHAGQAGLLPREIFQLDFATGRALSTAAIAVRDAKAASLRTRSHRATGTQETALMDLIESVEQSLKQEFSLEGEADSNRDK